QNEIGIFDAVGNRIAFRAERIGHALAVIDVHLAPIGLDEHLARRGGAFRDCLLLHGRHIEAFDGKIQGARCNAYSGPPRRDRASMARTRASTSRATAFRLLPGPNSTGSPK